MTLLSRSDRKFLPNLEGTSSQVGPGSYLRSDMDLGVGMKYSVAPFCSTSRRVLGNNDDRRNFQTPGPGSYNTTGKSPKDQKNLVLSSNFSSRVNRFDENKLLEDQTPGPGSYQTTANSISRDARKREIKAVLKERNMKKKQNIEYVKVFSTPSIPSNPNKRVSYGKSKQKSPGPGSYKMTNEMSQFSPYTKPSCFFQSRTGRSIFHKKKLRIPGPGTYFSHDAQDLKDYNEVKNPLKLTSTFASDTKRFNKFLGGDNEGEGIRPGPGKYLSINHSSTFVKSKKKPDRFQNFGSSSLRFGRMKDNTPGPGHFFQESGIFSSRRTKLNEPGSHLAHHPSQQLYRRSFHPPFLSNEKRFRATGKEKEIKEMNKQISQNPQAQILETRILEEKKLMKKGLEGKQRRSGPVPPFLSTEKRFRRSRKDENTPGVGNYDIRSQEFVKRIPSNRRSSRKKKRKGFGLKRRRTGFKKKPKKPELPGPGAYDINKISSFGRMKKTTRFQSEKRFKNDGSEDVPGPGAYNNYSSSFDRKVLKANVRSHHLQQSSSSHVKKKSDPVAEIRKWRKYVPGPGHYDTIDNWDKKSFNVSVM